jgi:peptidoglycan hydrolase-like amidase
MRSRIFLVQLLIVSLILGMTPVLPAVFANSSFTEQRFADPIDAFSVRMHGTEFSYSYRTIDGWSAWNDYEDDGDAIGESPESELIMVPRGTIGLRVRDVASIGDIHPIIVSHDPIRVEVAAVNGIGMPTVLSRNDWGAEEEYLFKSTTTSSAPSDVAKGDNGTPATVDQRVKDCLEAQQKHPTEFAMKSTVKTDATGREYLWPLQYSKEVKLLTVHHSALLVQGDPRPAVERVRALYKYHALSKSWGDIGYQFVIDENGQVYEGRLGGKYVVGGHAYCNNVGTIGIVLMGNFEIEQPSQGQAKSLQRLLSGLAKDYNIDVSKSVQFHGKTFDSPIVRHKDLLSTLCPGYYVTEAFGQIVKNVRSGNLDNIVLFPKRASSSSSSSSSRVGPDVGVPGASTVAPGITFIGRTSISINPGGKQRLSFSYTADQAGAYEGKKVAEVRISDPKIQLMVDDGRNWIPVTKGILLQSDLPAYESADLQLIVQAPMDPGSYSMQIGGITFTISVAGRRARTGDFVNPFSGGNMVYVTPAAQPKNSSLQSRVRPQTRLSTLASSASSRSSSSAASQSALSTPLTSSTTVRIRLSNNQNPSIAFADNGSANGTAVRGGTTFDLVRVGSNCEVRTRGERFTSGMIVRFVSSVSGVLSVNGIKDKTRSYKGTLECRVVDNALVLINELPLDDYMAGLSEEPDSEPYEKQRAFAIAARTYAAYYTNPANRKFPGKPYDGSDDPATFQAYAGVNFTAANPNWLRAVQNTANEVLMIGSQLIKPPYFSSDDGKTRTPAQAGWNNFPFADIFNSKPDPWCAGLTLRGHGVGMSGCGAKGQANEGRSAEQILQYYYPGTRIVEL